MRTDEMRHCVLVNKATIARRLTVCLLLWKRRARGNY